MRKVKVLLALFVLLGSVFGGAKASALDSSLVSSNYEYVITEYNVDMVVNENNTYDITERITADFNVPKHGIFRKIPLYNKITRQDGTKTNNRAKISNVKVSAPFSTEHEDGYLKLKIGDADKTLTGEQSYTISYNYNIGKDRAEGKDELYFDLIGSEWDTTISGVSYTITMPKEFDKDKLGFSTGTTGSMGSDMLSYYVSGNKITGKMYGTLKSGEGLNVRLELPEGYFVGAGIEINPVYYAFYVVPVSLTSHSFRRAFFRNPRRNSSYRNDYSALQQRSCLLSACWRASALRQAEVREWTCRCRCPDDYLLCSGRHGSDRRG